ncbi:hypothetical protein B7P43_G15744 [Cryptotermes secundus]|uniref:Mos1 transposase HTH domain-containing protein n=1 Tax=Cryptotermes secundus TaxID=105785 RepID=A0A2J7QWY7_9NEOP|nr:hypothetical protein B7P43_G15744 [Cryptotermes secundus]
MTDFREQRAAVKFCFLLGKSGTETLEMLKTAYKDDAMGKTQVFEWLSRFKNGEMSIDDKLRSGRPSMARTHENVEKIREIIKEDRRRTIEEIVELSGVTWSSVHPEMIKTFFLFPRMKRDMKGKCFADVAGVKEKTTEVLSSISKDEFRQCFEKWNKRLDKCISVSGEYFEED